MWNRGVDAGKVCCLREDEAGDGGDTRTFGTHWVGVATDPQTVALLLSQRLTIHVYLRHTAALVGIILLASDEFAWVIVAGCFGFGFGLVAVGAMNAGFLLRCVFV